MVSMKILALDTSTEYCSLALLLNGEMLTREALAGQRHSELILPMLHALMAEAGIQLKQLDGIAFGAGPGSFTGLRIACGVVQGLAFGAELPVAGVSTLQALAEGSEAPRVIACLDARMGEIYHAAYQKQDGVWHTVSEPALCSPLYLPVLEGTGWVGCGSGFDAYTEALQSAYAGQIKHITHGVSPHARHIASLAMPVFQQGRGVDASLAAPYYIRDKVALKTNER